MCGGVPGKCGHQAMRLSPCEGTAAPSHAVHATEHGQEKERRRSRRKRVTAPGCKQVGLFGCIFK